MTLNKTLIALAFTLALHEYRRQLALEKEPLKDE